MSVKRSPSRSRISVCGTIVRAVPRVLGVERHLLDEPQLVAAVEAPLEQVGHVGVVDAAHGDGVDLHRRQPGIRGGLEPGHDVVEAVAAGEPAEVLGVDRVEADVDPVQARGGQRRGEPVEPDAVGRHRDPRPRFERGDPAHDVDQAAAQQRLATGEPHLGDAQADHDGRPRRTSSSSVSISGLGSQSRPSAGMQ